MTGLDLADGLRIIHGVDTEGGFGHQAHLQFAWNLLDEAGDVEEAERVANMTIRHAAELAGTPDKYHCTVTDFWIRVLAHVRETHAEADSLEGALKVMPALADPELPRRYWSRLDDPEAKQHWVEPDLKPLP